MATTQSCSSWLHALQTMSGAGGAIQRNIGATYLALADLNRNREAKRQLREEAFRTYEGVLKNNPSDVLALLGLANASDGRDERIRHLRQVIAVDPRQLIALQSLASELTQAGGREELLEAARLWERAYSAQTGLNKWHLAATAKLRYVEAGDEDAALALRKRVRSDIDADRMLKQLELASIAGARASDILEVLCYRPVITVLGVSDCLAAIEAALRRVISASQAEKASMQAVAESIVSVMGKVAPAEEELSQTDPAWRATFARGVERLVVAGFGTSTLYETFAGVVKDPREQLRLLERAAALAPQDGGIAVRLGEEYLEQRRKADAAREFRRAKSLIPESQHELLDYYLKETGE